mgnify:CR=1 FL=1
MQFLKPYISLVLTLAFTISMVWQTATIAHFYMNRAAITEAYCINKEKPQLNCHGQCHLKKQLEVKQPQEAINTEKTTLKTAMVLFVFSSNPSFGLLQLPSNKNLYPSLEFHVLKGQSRDILAPPKMIA